MTIGVLALQGAFIEHIHMLEKLGVDCFEIRKKSDLNRRMDGIILPGGESTTMGKLLNNLDLKDELKRRIENGLPVFGTCAGIILLAKEIEGQKNTHFATMDIVVKRNAYGRQLGSFESVNPFDGTDVPMVFIRAPYIVSCGKNAKILATCDGKIVSARQGNQLVTAFHPELTDNTFIHKYFIDNIVTPYFNKQTHNA